MRPSAVRCARRSSGCRSRAGSRRPRESRGTSSASNVPGIGFERDLGVGRERQARAHRGEQPVDRAARRTGSACRRRRTRCARAVPRRAAAPLRGRRRSASTYASSGSVAARLVRIEVAVRALAHAPRDVDVERERRQRRVKRGCVDPCDVNAVHAPHRCRHCAHCGIPPLTRSCVKQAEQCAQRLAAMADRVLLRRARARRRCGRAPAGRSAGRSRSRSRRAASSITSPCQRPSAISGSGSSAWRTSTITQ